MPSPRCPSSSNRPKSRDWRHPTCLTPSSGPRDSLTSRCRFPTIRASSELPGSSVVERRTVNPLVGGSNPSRGAIKTISYDIYLELTSRYKSFQPFAFGGQFQECRKLCGYLMGNEDRVHDPSHARSFRGERLGRFAL